MKYEIEVTTRQKQLVELVTPAYFKTDFRQVKITDEKIIEVNDSFCLIHLKSDKYSRYDEVLGKCVKEEGAVSSKIDFENSLTNLINNLK